MQGQLFTQDFLLHGIRETPPYQDLSAAALAAFNASLHEVFAGLSAASTLNEAQTEQLVIERVLGQLGWGSDYLPQVNLSGRRREDVPDILLFANNASYLTARDESRDDRRYRHGIALLEAKRWLRPLDRGDSSEAADPGAPSSQMLRYLSRADVTSDRAVRWGILTNGAVWRLYWQDARSRAEEFFELDVAALLGLPGAQQDLDAYDAEHGLKLLFLMFNRAAFLAQPWDSEARTFHSYALNEARAYEERVSQDLGARVFADIFPALAQALTKAGDYPLLSGGDVNLYSLFVERAQSLVHDKGASRPNHQLVHPGAAAVHSPRSLWARAAICIRRCRAQCRPHERPPPESDRG